MLVRLHAEQEVTLSGDDVSSWGNTGSLGGSWDQGTASRRPLYAGETGTSGKQCVTFDGVDDYVLATTVGTFSAAKMTIYAVIESPGTGFMFDISSGRLALKSSDGSNVAWFDSAWRTVTGVTSALQLLVYQLDSATVSSAIRDGASLGTNSYADRGYSGGTWTVGAAVTAAQAWDGKMCELGVFSPARDAATLAKLVTYCQQTWGTP